MWGFRTRFWLLVAFLMFFAGSAHAVEPGDPVAVRISKSGVVRLADANREFSQHVTYLPAGKRLVLFLPTATVGKRKWQLAMTDDGLFVYLLTDGLHYYNLGSSATEYGSRLAVIQRQVDVEVEGSPTKRRLSPSELYAVIGKSEDKWKIRHAGKSLPNESFDAWVPDAAISVFDTSDLNVSEADTSKFAFKEENFFSSISIALGKLKAAGISDRTLGEVENFLTSKVVQIKRCHENIVIQPIQFSTTVAVGTKAKILEFLFPLSAEVGASASFKVDTIYPPKFEFEVSSASRETRDGIVLYSIQSQATRTDCSAAVVDRRVIVQRDGRLVAELNDQMANNLKLKLNSIGYMDIPCRDRYFELYDTLVREHGASADVLAYLIAHFTSFTGEDASVCPK